MKRNGVECALVAVGRSDGSIIKVPSAKTLKKYGLDAESWLAILDAQGWACAICKMVPRTGRLNTDHFHVKRWKKLPAEKRRRYVRGLTCWNCNRYYLGRGINIQRAISVVAYLRAFEARLESLGVRGAD